MIQYKINICDALREAGYTSSQLQKEGKLNAKVWTKLNREEPVSLESLGKVCHLLHKQPGDLIEFVNG